MILTPEQAEERLKSSANLANRFGKPASSSSSSPQPTVIPIERPGRKSDVPNMSPEIREEIAFRARLGERQAKLASEFSTTQARVSQLERGKDKSLDNATINAGVRDVAVEKLMESLNLISRDKLQKETAQGLSRVASNMAKVVNLTQERSNEKDVTVIVYAPQLRSEESFKTIDV